MNKFVANFLIPKTGMRCGNVQNYDRATSLRWFVIEEQINNYEYQFTINLIILKYLKFGENSHHFHADR